MTLDNVDLSAKGANATGIAENSAEVFLWTTIDVDPVESFSEAARVGAPKLRLGRRLTMLSWPGKVT